MVGFAGCPDETRAECQACKGTGRRGAKANGKKICRSCDGQGTVPWCAKHDTACPIEACKSIMW